ncbi:MAG TPA: carbohydrate binding family 9 domain-containing protein [Hyphomicrobiales bacterium]|nr:carbohydrate binding family 9 domain-containing protein [Hyphomicrobiales bacterium]
MRVATAPVIDGVLDEAVWQQAEPITDFHQIRPGDGTAPSEDTTVYIVYTEDALYIAAVMNDSEPDRIAAPTIRHGQGLGPDDRLVIILDPFNTRRTGYRFETNLNAVRHDALYQNISSFSADWNTIWDVRSTRFENGWIAEIEIPFKSLPFDPATEAWGFNFGRGIRRRGEEMAWVSYNRTYNPSISGTMTGISGISQGAGLDVVPSFSVTQHRDFATDSTHYEEQPSLDAFYRLTPSLNAALTVNTDFSATEVDNRQVNLTRFNLFFPEKRDFFLNDSDLFQFGNIGNTGGNSALAQNARPYFSRKIGLSATGAPVDIEYGGRISGRVGRWNIGTLAIRQDGSGAVDPTTLFVSRVSANVLAESNVGFVFTDGDPTSNRGNSVAGVDFRYLNTRLGNGVQLEGDAWYQQSRTPGLDGDDAAFGFGIRSPNSSGLRGGLGFKEVQRNFNPAMGYINRVDIRDYTADGGYTHFFDGGLLQTAFVGFNGQRVTDLDGNLQSQELSFSIAELQTNARDYLTLEYNRNREVVLHPFVVYSEPGRVVSIGPGDYRFDEFAIFFGTGDQRMLSASFDIKHGDFYDGVRDNYEASLNWNQSRFFRLSLNYDYNDISLPQGDFITRLVSVNSQVAFNSQWFWVTLVQYDNVSELMGINTRLQWIPKAGQEGFVVLNYGLEDFDKDNTFKSATADLSVKFKYTLRF